MAKGVWVPVMRISPVEPVSINNWKLGFFFWNSLKQPMQQDCELNDLFGAAFERCG